MEVPCFYFHSSSHISIMETTENNTGAEASTQTEQGLTCSQDEYSYSHIY